MNVPQVDASLDWIETKIPEFRRLHRELRTLVVAVAPDGYPSRGGDDPVFSHSGDVTDRTFEAVRQRLEGKNDATKALQRFLGALVEARRQLSIAESQAMQAFPPLKVEGEPDEKWCRSCQRIDVFSPAYRGQLCRFCYDWTLAHNDVFPPATLVKCRADGRRITTKLVAELERKPGQPHVGESL